MSSFAIVIGIDAYTNKDWNLSAAVSDALRFAEWARASGGVAPENLRLLLSPVQAHVTPLPYKEANCRNIKQTILEFQKGAGQGGDRLYFYYAGHGVSAPGVTAGGPLEPVIIPVDVQSLEQDSNLLLGFSMIMPLFTNVKPTEQFFFIDACCGFELQNFRPAIGASVGPWSPPNSEAGPRSAQYILYATAPGLRAYEKIRGRGVFANALLDGLRGTSTALVWSTARVRYEVRFSTLVDYVRSRVEREIGQQRHKDWSRYVQIPEPASQGGALDPVLATFAPSEVVKAVVRVRVGPSQARPTCRVQFFQYLQGGQREVEIEAIGPPAPISTTFDLSPGDYSLLAQADMYDPVRETYPLYEARAIELKLQRGSQGALQQSAQSGQYGGLCVYTADQNAVIVVRDPERQVKGSGVGNVYLPSLSPGIYRVQLVLPEGPAEERTIEVPAGRITSRTLDAPGPQMGQGQMHMLKALNISTDDKGYLYPSEHLGGVANAKLASLLGFAAYAAMWPDTGDFIRLKSVGVESFKDIPPGDSGLLVLIGVGGKRPAPGVSVSRFLSSGQIIARDFQSKVVDKGGFEVLAGFRAAAQRCVHLRPGPVGLELRLPGFAPTRYALAILPDRVTVLVAVAEDNGEVAVQQYLLPLRWRVHPPMDYFIDRPSNIQRLEIAQRYYANGHQIPDGDLSDLLYGKWLDPLLGCLAGYSLIRTGNQARFIGQIIPGQPPDVPQPSALHNMLRFFDGLPDSHILAGLCEPERSQRRSEYYTHALERGLPVFAEGFWALHTWYKETNAELPPALVEPSKGLLPASPWTAWVSPGTS